MSISLRTQRAGEVVWVDFPYRPTQMKKTAARLKEIEAFRNAVERHESKRLRVLG